MDTSIVVFVVVVVCLLFALALARKDDVEALFKGPLFTFSLKAKGTRRVRKRTRTGIE